jgi:outer membrane receptor for ferrienterochelin and colicin
VALYHTEARRRLETVRRDFVRETSGALFAEAEARMTPWLRAIPGLRTEIVDDGVRSSASTIFNAQATYAITQWARLTLDVFNLLNAQVDDIAYFYKSRLPGEPAPRADVHFHPAESCSVRVTTAVTF